MENCPETRYLVQWLNGVLNESESSTTESHVEQCESCQQKLLTLTDDFSVQPPADPNAILESDTFTDEPHFHSMRERLSRNVAKLKFDPSEPDNIAVASIRTSDGETVAVGDASTENNEKDLALSETSSSETIRIDGFFLESHIGSGGFAHVFKAWENKLARPVAIKLLDKNRINARNRHRFLREAKAASSVQSPHVVQVLTSGESDSGQPFIAMELVEGNTLAQWIADKSKQKLDSEAIERGVKLVVQVCDGVQAVHHANLIHRDIKPSNIFIDSATSTAKLGDFGLIRILGDDTVTLTRAAELAGTPAYMSPEQTIPNGDIESTSDVYSLGATLYQTLTGQPPFRGSSVAILKQVNESQPLPPQQLNEFVTKDLETICLKALEKEPQRRYQSAAEMADDLRAAIEGQPIKARPLSKLQRGMRWAAKNRTLATVVALLFASLMLGTITSTALWLNSDYHAGLANDRFVALSSSDASLRESESALRAREATLKNSQAEMRRAVRSMVSNTFARKSSYLGIDGPNRNVMMRQLGLTYQAIFDESPDDRESVREIIKDLANVAEFGLDLHMDTAVPDLVFNNRKFADHLFEFPDPPVEDRMLVATVYNQFGEAKLIEDDIESAAESFLKAQAITTVSSDDDANSNDLYLQHLRSTKSLLAMRKGDPEATQELKELLDDITEIRDREPDLPAEWMVEHSSILLNLAKRHQGKESIKYRLDRGRVLSEFIARSSTNGQETFWEDRKSIVNDTFTAMEFLKIGDPDSARPILRDAIDRMNGLLEIYPRVVQFRADFYEMLIIAGNIEWNSSHETLAMELWNDAISEFEVSLKINAKDNRVRRRFAQVLQMVADRHARQKAIDDSVECLKKAEIQMQVVIDSPIEVQRKQADQESLDQILARRKQLENAD
jgi:tRNA A-37 threonylcarbamoyl transferase component Bud32/tetratricopeptide (TPR) repeat protein